MSGTCRRSSGLGTRLPPVSEATVLVYSHRPEVREAVRTAVGRRPASDVGPLTWVECETGDEVITAVDLGGIDLYILDGEAQPTGGLALSRQMKEEVLDPPALCVLIARQPDRWLAHWALADGTLPFPIDPLTAPRLVADLLREHAARPPVARPRGALAWGAPARPGRGCSPACWRGRISPRTTRRGRWARS